MKQTNNGERGHKLIEYNKHAGLGETNKCSDLIDKNQHIQLKNTTGWNEKTKKKK